MFRKLPIISKIYSIIARNESRSEPQTLRSSIQVHLESSIFDNLALRKILPREEPNFENYPLA